MTEPAPHHIASIIRTSARGSQQRFHPFGSPHPTDNLCALMRDLGFEHLTVRLNNGQCVIVTPRHAR
jgi:hypothetical protein